EVLAPLGIRRMRLGKTLLAQRAPGEVTYYDERTGPAVMGAIGTRVSLPYGTWSLEAMDSHGGWLASAADLVRFASAFDVPERCPLLQPKTIDVRAPRRSGRLRQKRQGDADLLRLRLAGACARRPWPH